MIKLRDYSTTDHAAFSFQVLIKSDFYPSKSYTANTLNKFEAFCFKVIPVAFLRQLHFL